MAQKKETKAKEKAQTKTLKATLNKYGFVRFSKYLLETLGWIAKTEIELTVEVGEGKVTFSRKADA